MKILFVCTANICRSAAAEAMLRTMLERENITGVDVDSAGTRNFAGRQRDEMLVDAAREAGYIIDGVSKYISDRQLEEADLILVMTQEHRQQLTRLIDYDKWDKIHLFMDYCHGLKVPVPDPYCGTEYLYQETLRTLEDGCRVIIDRIKSGN